MQIFEILTEIITLVAVLLTFFQIRTAYQASLNEKYIDLRFKTYSEFLEAFCELPSTIKEPPREHLKFLIYHYHRVIVITPEQYIGTISDYYDKYIKYYTASLSCAQTDEQLYELASIRKHLIVILNSLILSCDKSYCKKKKLKN